jgi:hypothetical protein
VSLVAQGVVRASPAPAGVLLRELTQERPELLVELLDDRGESLGGVALTNNGTRPAFRNPELRLKLNDRLTTTVRG